MNNTITQTQVATQEATDSINSFIKTYEVTKLLHSCRAHKKKGFASIDIFRYLLAVMFSPISTYMAMQVGTYKEAFSKNTIYRFCNNSDVNWHKFVRLLSERIIRLFFRPATSDDRIEYFIFDDTPFAKFGRKTELVAKFFNHVNMNYEFGFRILTMLWTDGFSNIPIDFCPLSSTNPALLRCPAKDVDKRSLAGINRKNAQRPAPDIMHDMIAYALKAGHSAKYVLFDSWFSSPKCITDIKTNLKLDVIAMIKKSSKVYYEYDGKQMDIKKIYTANKKRRGRSKYLLSVNVNLIQKEKGKVISRIPARIVCVRNKSNKKEWIALISTDTSITEEEIIRRYGSRWNIEVFFKTCKQYLKMTKECRSTSFDAMTCHLAIVCIRYMMLSLYQRSNSDERSLGELFWSYATEVAEISFNQAMNLIVMALLETVKEFFAVSDEQMSLFVDSFISKLPTHLQLALHGSIKAIAIA